ncbi:MAG: D-cysteine desulfhydrase [Bacteroidetes bacterium GWF2_42_66]|nr:MAG: D-cysteine desulfhydrase [Bacteroidetes bacterium GWA2_42_15]OFX98807.1 MAG: D-cysteine desulfhydrase [Bacteroidetes bacterium GWE2_42_39]OFY42996.1 MAG: D-cysteine desulfhydrase [Bacteroidetes bacterium GWF2_42_66]HBL77172.1 D-cysteine desulfhydrase family protein [Prolixibacteraceae bacterium]HCU59774.1 D-cysteine desulfhydrase family protein [Prolixibacteraceae bacterium]
MKKKMTLGFFPTPMHELKTLSKMFSGYRVFIKRDDLNGLATGGNKVRKLEYLLQDALEKGHDTVITAGAQQSNHCRLTAAACAKVGLKCHLVLGGQEPEQHEGNLLLSGLFGAKIHFTGDNRKGEDMQLIAEQIRKEGANPYLIPYGGSTEIGALGYSDAMLEMKSQMKETGQWMDYIVFASSSGGTHAGLLAGRELHQLNSKLIGISIDKDETNGHSLETIIADLYRSVMGMYGIKNIKEVPGIELLRGYDKAGYGVITGNELKAIKVLAEAEGILLDPVYTARAFYGMMDLMDRKELKPNSNVLFLHTGGLPAIFHYSKELNQKKNAG